MIARKSRGWSRDLWGVVLLGVKGLPWERPVLLGAAWENASHVCYPGSVARALVFRTRKEAREWVREKGKGYFAGRFRVVQVRERVEEMIRGGR